VRDRNSPWQAGALGAVRLATFPKAATKLTPSTTWALLCSPAPTGEANTRWAERARDRSLVKEAITPFKFRRKSSIGKIVFRVLTAELWRGGELQGCYCLHFLVGQILMSLLPNRTETRAGYQSMFIFYINIKREIFLTWKKAFMK
jgi:hypothetical protein